MAESALRNLFPSARDRILSQQGQMPSAPMPQETFRGQAFNTMYDMFGGNSDDPARRAQATRRAEGLVGAGRFAADFTPVVGDALAIDEAREAYRQGNMGQAAILGGLATLGMVPVVGDAASKTVRGALKNAPQAPSPLEGTLDMSQAASIPPLQNSQKTQLGSSTLPSYAKAKELLSSKNRILDFGAGRGQGASLIGADTFEPYPREGFNPSFSNVADIPSGSYDGLTSLNVLNVMPREVRDDAVRNIGRVLMQNGEAVITTRGRDVMTANGVDGSEPMSRITTANTYQKGFTQPELSKYVSSILGSGFTVSNLPQKIGAAGVLVKKNAVKPT